MKKLIFIEVVILILLIAVAVTAVMRPDLLRFTTDPTDPAVEAAATDPVETPEPAMEATAPPETEPPETQPPVVVELEESWAEVLAGHTLTATDYFVYDLDREVFLSSSDNITDKTLYPASITKLWSAYVALQYIDPEETVTVGSELTMIDPASSVAGLQEGDTMTARELVAAMLLPSGNDATYVLATAVGRILMHNPDMRADWAVERFVYQMNALAKNQGMRDSSFVTPDGIHDENHYISPEDMITIGRLALADPILSQYAASHSETVAVSQERSLTWKNTNILLNEESDYYCSYATGLKTGYTTPAGNCLLSSFQVGHQELLIGVFGCPGSLDRFADTLLLFTQVYDLEIPEPEPVYDQAA